MRLNIPNAGIVRESQDGRLRLVRRRMNQNPTYYVIMRNPVGGDWTVLHSGSYRYCRSKFTYYLGTNEFYNWFSSN